MKCFKWIYRDEDGTIVACSPGYKPGPVASADDNPLGIRHFSQLAILTQEEEMKVKQNETPLEIPDLQDLAPRRNPLDVNPPPLKKLSEARSEDFKPNAIFINDIADGHTPKDNLEDKDTNPKDVLAACKLPLSLVPDTMVIYASLAFLEGALKYGRYNWRVAGVRSSIYLDALKRHIADYENGEDVDPKTKVPHLANALACLGIIIDAKEVGKLNDDRPPRAPIGDLIRSLESEVVRLKELFKEHHPHQYTIADSPTETTR